MNSKEKDKDDTNKPYYDINLGASFRYIVLSLLPLPNTFISLLEKMELI